VVPAEPANADSIRSIVSQSSNQSPTLRLPFICEAGQKLTYLYLWYYYM
jgi:hypothetical protein